MRLVPATLLALLAVTAARGAGEKLPPRHCVAELRAARIAGQREDPAAELAALRHAVESCPGELEPVVALLSYGSSHELPPADVAALDRTMLERLAAPGAEIPITVLQQIAAAPGLDDEIENALLAHVERRVQSGGDAPALRLLATLQLRRGDRTAAVSTLERLRKSDASPDLPWILAGLYAELGRWQELSRLLEENEDAPDDAMSFLRIEALSRAGRGAETIAAVKQLDATLATAGGQATQAFVELAVRAAWNLRDAQDDAAAEEMFRLALARDPENQQAREALTLLYGTAEELEQHRVALEERLSAETDPRVLFDEGTNRLAEGDNTRAFELLAKAAPGLDIEAAWYNLGVAAARLERWSDAAEALGHAARINPARADTHFFRGHALVAARRFGEAIPALKKALDLEPGRAMTHMDLAIAYHETGQAELAEKHRKLYESAPRDAAP